MPGTQWALTALTATMRIPAVTVVVVVTTVMVVMTTETVMIVAVVVATIPPPSPASLPSPNTRTEWLLRAWRRLARSSHSHW